MAADISATDLMKGTNSVVSIKRSPGNDKGETARLDLPFLAAIKVVEARRIEFEWFHSRVRLLVRGDFIPGNYTKM